MVQVDGAESGGLVDPGVACWVGMSGEPEAREERGLSPWQFAVRGATWSSAELGLRSKPFGPVHSGAILDTLLASLSLCLCVCVCVCSRAQLASALQ